MLDERLIQFIVKPSGQRYRLSGSQSNVRFRGPAYVFQIHQIRAARAEKSVVKLRFNLRESFLHRALAFCSVESDVVPAHLYVYDVV